MDKLLTPKTVEGGQIDWFEEIFHDCSFECRKMYMHSPRGHLFIKDRNPGVFVGELGAPLNG